MEIGFIISVSDARRPYLILSVLLILLSSELASVDLKFQVHSKIQ